jgi:hypothetical protein
MRGPADLVTSGQIPASLQIIFERLQYLAASVSPESDGLWRHF